HNLLPMLYYHFPEPLEQMNGIIRSRTCLRMVLDRYNGQCDMTHAFFRAVVEIPVGKFCFAAQAMDINAIVMILGCYFHPPGLNIFYRMVASMVAELEFVRLAAHRQTKYLVAQADAEYRPFPNQFSHIFNGICNGFGI